MLAAFVGYSLLLAACGSPQDPSPPRAPAAKPATVRVFSSSATASVGSRISVSLGGTMADGTPVAGVDGWLRFAPAALRYVGVAQDAATTIAANDSGATRGRVRVLAVRPGQLNPDAAVLAFDVLKTDYLSTLTFEAGAAVSPTGKLQRGGGTRRAEVRSSLSAVATIRPSDGRKNGVKQLMLPTIYGDADASGAVAQGDANLVGAWVVGNGAPPDTVTFNIVNVAPQNLPGIGGPTDTLPPGWGPPFLWGGFLRRAALNDPPISLVCERMLNLDDLLLISQEAGGTNVEVPGELMPAGSQRPTCADTPADTTRPAVPYDEMLPAGDSLIVVSPPAEPGEPTPEYFRTVFFVLFRADAPGATVREVLQRYDARIVGGMRDGTYIIEVPDPGASYTLYEAFLNSLKAEPAVDLVMPYDSRPIIRSDGRYPTDGAGFVRADWLSGSPATWALRAIRAPLAWGCETGMYGSSGTTTVAALEVMMPPSAHADLTSSLVGGVRYGVPQAGQAAMNALARDTAQVHANGVMGHLAASGDNSQFAAGVLWATRLVRLSNADASGRPAIPVHMLQNVVSPTVQSEGIRVVNISMEWYTTRPDQQEAVTRAFRSLLSDNPDLILVKAMANDGRTAQPTNLAEIRRMGAFNYALSILAGEGFGDRIVFVAGTAPGNTWYSQSNFIHGVTDIAAPAEDVALLNLPGSGTFGQFPRLHSGTSYAAPLVAGAIAQLLTMDPSLTPSQITSYLKRGAQEPKQNPTSGAVPSAADSTTWRVQGAGNRAVYQLDLYGSLTLLSRERQGTPLCGVELVYRRNFPASTWSVTANREAPELLISNAPAFSLLGSTGYLSVAQGGRRLALGAQPYALQGGSWQPSVPVPDADLVFYAERDTLHVRGRVTGTRGDLEVRINGGSWRNVTQSLPAGAFSSGFTTSGWHFAPTGDLAVVDWRWWNGPGTDVDCNPQGFGGGDYLIDLRSPGVTPFATFSGVESCSSFQMSGVEEEDIASWRRDGAEFIRAVWAGFPAYELRRYRVTSTGWDELSRGPVVPGYFAEYVDWAPEGGRLAIRESARGYQSAVPCQLTLRRAPAPHELLEPELPLNFEACDWRPRLAPLREQLLATITTGAPEAAPRGTSPARLRRDPFATAPPGEYFMRAN